jgi:hypothetical protein
MAVEETDLDISRNVIGDSVVTEKVSGKGKILPVLNQAPRHEDVLCA